MKYIAGCSGGNDSIALIQLMINKGLDFAAVYNDTGWSRDDWGDRMLEVRSWLSDNNIELLTTESEGLEALVRRKKGWPMPASKMQFCTSELKEKPTTELLAKIDPDCELTFVTGRRRAESLNRSDMEQHELNSRKHGGRDVWNPLYLHDESRRDELIDQTPFKTLPHQSMECYPCVCANKTDLAAMPLNDPKIDRIEIIEIEMGHTRNDKPRTMFRPYRVGGGVGIRQAVAWGRGERGYKSEYVPNEYKVSNSQFQMFEGVSDVAYEIETKAGKEFSRQCDGGYCGS